MPDYALQIKVRNGMLLAAMRAAGFQTASALADAAKVSSTEVGKYLNLELPPLRNDGELRPGAFAICRVLGKSVEQLFPPQHMETPLSLRRAELFCDLADIEQMLGEDHSAMQALEDVDARVDAGNRIRRLLPLLSDRQRSVITRRYGLDGRGCETLEDIAKEDRVTRERVRQLECKALRIMKKQALRIMSGKP